MVTGDWTRANSLVNTSQPTLYFELETWDFDFLTNSPTVSKRVSDCLHSGDDDRRPSKS